MIARGMPPRANRKAPGAFFSVTGTQGTPEKAIFCHAKGIVADLQHPGMYRLRFSDGLSDMTNLTRAKDALRSVSNL